MFKTNLQWSVAFVAEGADIFIAPAGGNVCSSGRQPWVKQENQDSIWRDFFQNHDQLHSSYQRYFYSKPEYLGVQTLIQMKNNFPTL